MNLSFKKECVRGTQSIPLQGQSHEIKEFTSLGLGGSSISKEFIMYEDLSSIPSVNIKSQAK